MAVKSNDETASQDVSVQDVMFMPLIVFADTNASKYGIELMGGFVHVQEQAKKFADTEANWHKAMEDFSKKEVK